MRRLLTRVERRRLLSAMIALTFCLSAMLGLLAIPSSDTVDSAVRDGPTGNDVTPVRTLAMAAHDPILIDGNAGFTGPNASTGVTRGSGTESDPYVIEGWEIDAPSIDGIRIQDTDAWFVVRNCDVHNAESTYENYHAICLRNCTNADLEDNICNTKAGYGIFLSSSSNNALKNNNCSSNYLGGVGIIASNSNTVANNSCSSNHLDGMVLDSSSGNTLRNNTFSSNDRYDIRLVNSNGNDLVGNNCSSSNWYGLTLYGLDNDNLIHNNSIGNHLSYGIRIDDPGDDNRIWNNSFIGNNGGGVQAFDDGQNNSWNSTEGYGNWWSDWQSPDDVPPYGIVDLPYNIPGSATAKDNFPLTTPKEPIPEFSLMPFVVMILLVAIVLTTGARRRKA